MAGAVSQNNDDNNNNNKKKKMMKKKKREECAPGMVTVPIFTACTECPAWSGMMLVLGLRKGTNGVRPKWGHCKLHVF